MRPLLPALLRAPLLASLLALGGALGACANTEGDASLDTEDTAMSTSHDGRDTPRAADARDERAQAPDTAGAEAGGASATSELATFGGGCFWCVEAVLEQLPGVLDVRSGYMGGALVQPSYQAVCSGETGHIEVVEARFDPARVTYGELVDWFWKLHDPTSKDRQGGDAGIQYRSVIFTHSPEQERIAKASRDALNASGTLKGPVVTEILPATTFWPAEDYHQDYYRENRTQPYCQAVIVPKLRKLGLKD